MTAAALTAAALTLLFAAAAIHTIRHSDPIHPDRDWQRARDALHRQQDHANG